MILLGSLSKTKTSDPEYIMWAEITSLIFGIVKVGGEDCVEETLETDTGCPKVLLELLIGTYPLNEEALGKLEGPKIFEERGVTGDDNVESTDEHEGVSMRGVIRTERSTLM